MDISKASCQTLSQSREIPHQNNDCVSLLRNQRAKVATLIQTFNQKIYLSSSLNAQIRRLQEQIAQLLHFKTQLDQKVTEENTIRHYSQSLAAENLANKNQIAALNVESHRAKAHQLRLDYGKKQSSFQYLLIQKEKLSKCLQICRRQKDEAVSKLQLQLMQSQQQFQKAREELSQVSAKNKLAEDQNSSKEQEIQNLRQQLNKTIEQERSIPPLIMSQIMQNNKLKAELTFNCQKANNSIKRNHQEIADLQIQIAKKEHHIKQKAQSAHELKKKCKTAQSSLQSLANQLLKSEAKTQGILNSLDKERSKVEALQTQLSQERQQIESLKAHLKQVSKEHDVLVLRNSKSHLKDLKCQLSQSASIRFHYMQSSKLEEVLRNFRK